ncbi:YeeE/YedE family protein [Acetobacterium bakii]|uniref:YeeE/YedE family protein n=2 Tax=Acetobacterium bakii TaxID=52689 RepID=A0A0L6U4F4_9FIRM|nr:YeeE/YedE thiosulfate transporter family protein [Acetobacterium bakii]KNZ43389.1 YeeE/YedE family protein [Acetobacterium bakii]
MNMEQKKKFEDWFKHSWTYVTGAILLSFMQIITLAITGHPWGITSAFAFWGSRLINALGGDSYFPVSSENIQTYQAWFLQDPVTLRNIGIIVGATLAALLASQFRVKKIKSKKQIIGVAAGGLLMGYGSSIASGCNIGAFYSGIASMSLSGWVFGVFLFVGAIIGGKLLIRFFM